MCKFDLSTFSFLTCHVSVFVFLNLPWYVLRIVMICLFFLDAAENACRVVQKKGYKLLMTLVGDSLLEPFWPTGWFLKTKNTNKKRETFQLMLQKIN